MNRYIAIRIRSELQCSRLLYKAIVESTLPEINKYCLIAGINLISSNIRRRSSYFNLLNMIADIFGMSYLE